MEVSNKKQIERRHYNKAASKIKNIRYAERRHSPALELPDDFCKSIISNLCKEKTLLDYGCGIGLESVYFAKRGARVIAIDISEKSLNIAKQLAKSQSVSDKISFKQMDAESLKIKNDSIDIIYNRGTLSCVNLNKALSEWARVLKPAGIAIGRDTLGHNPLFNLNRKIKYLQGKRTKQTLNNILKIQDLKTFNLYFKKTEFKFFNLTNILPLPYPVYKFLQKIDNIILNNTFLKRYAFKVVFILSNPVKPNKKNQNANKISKRT